MSNQTKEQALGYILKAMSYSQFNLIVITEVYKKFEGIVKKYELPLDNWSTMEIMNKSVEGEIYESDFDRLTSTLYFLYDSTTVEEAGEFLEDIEPLLKNHF